jgi:hypothetical protein
MGGLGNQFHQLSLALYLRNVLGYEVSIDEYSGYVSDDFGRESIFGEMNGILNFKKTKKFIFQFYFIKIFKFFCLYLNLKLANWIYKVENINQSLNCLVGNKLTKEDQNIYLEGYWVQNAFNFKSEFLSLYNSQKQTLYKNLNSQDLVIHYRADRFSEVLQMEYFTKVVTYHLQNNTTSRILIFSDSRSAYQLSEYLMSHIPFCPFVDVDLTDYKSTLLLDTILTYKFFIPSLGTFSYWASALGENRVIYLPIEFLEVLNLSHSNKYIFRYD